MRRTSGIRAGLCLAVILARPLAAQIAWDTPRLVGPESPSGVGCHWMRAETLPGDHNAVFGSFSLPGTGGAVTAHGGIGTGVAEENAVFGGVDLRAPIARHSATQPLDLEWSGGAGLSVGEYQLASVPVAVSAGRSWASGSVWFAPYVSVGATFDYRRGDSDLVPDEEFEIQATAGIGVDMAFDAARRFVLRAAAALGERQAVAVGMVIGR
ncbi:MAG: hypothetical protein FJ207_13275 [Gemmatimonadetes bacterium]|nr:hypothetical protein [Gemmatimonadota bacterium]